MLQLRVKIRAKVFTDTIWNVLRDNDPSGFMFIT